MWLMRRPVAGRRARAVWYQTGPSQGGHAAARFPRDSTRAARRVRRTECGSALGRGARGASGQEPRTTSWSWLAGTRACARGRVRALRCPPPQSTK